LYSPSYVCFCEVFFFRKMTENAHDVHRPNRGRFIAPWP